MGDQRMMTEMKQWKEENCKCLVFFTLQIGGVTGGRIWTWCNCGVKW